MADEFEFHPNALIAFNQQAEEIASAVVELPPPGPQRGSFTPDVYPPVPPVTDADIHGDLVLQYTTPGDKPFARALARPFLPHVGLIGESHDAMTRLAESIQRTRTLADRVGFSFVRDRLFKWAVERKLEAVSVDFISYLTAECRGTVADQIVVVPIADLWPESSFSIAGVAFDVLSAEWFARCVEPLLNPVHPETNKDYEEWRSRFQGLAGATVQVSAEPGHAVAVGVRRTEIALVGLRTLSPANWMAELVCNWVPVGSERIRKQFAFTLQGSRLAGAEDRLLDVKRLIHLNSQDLRQMTEMLTPYTLLATAERRSPFQELAMTALETYSKASLRTEMADRLLYIFAALESILLRDDSEPLQHNVAERLAFLVGEDVDTRRRIIRDVKKAYAIRSRFVHHGRTIDDSAAFQRFGSDAFEFFRRLPLDAQRFETHQAFHEHIERMRLS